MSQMALKFSETGTFNHCPFLLKTYKDVLPPKPEANIRMRLVRMSSGQGQVRKS